MTVVHEIQDLDLSFWGPGCRFFGDGDGLYLLVRVDSEPDPALADRITYIPGPTMVFHTTETGHVTDMGLKTDYPPLTTHEQALELAGFTLVAE